MTDGGTDSFFNDEQPLKAKSPIEVTVGGIVISSKAEHPQKVPLSIFSIADLNSTFFKDVHPKNAFSPIVFICGGIVISFNCLHLEKIDSFISMFTFDNKRLKMSRYPFSIAKDNGALLIYFYFNFINSQKIFEIMLKKNDFKITFKKWILNLI